MPAAGLVIPAIVSVPAVLLASAQDAPTRVMVATWPEVVSVAVQLEKPVGRVMAAPEVGMMKPEGSVTEMVLPTASLPLDEVVKPTVHVEVALAAADPGVKVTADTEVAVMVTADDGLTAVTSWEVATLNPLAT